MPDETEEAEERHPVPAPFNPMASLNTTNGTSTHVHSVVPDLMKVYESLTKGHETVEGRQGQQSQTHSQQAQQMTMPPPPQQPYQQQMQQPQPAPNTAAYLHVHQQPQSFQPHPPEPQPQTQHVNYSLITSEEQYRQLCQIQSAQSSNPGAPAAAASPPPPPLAPVQHDNQRHVVSSLPYIPTPYQPPNGAPAAEVPTNSQPNDPERAPSDDGTSGRPSAASSRRRKRGSFSQGSDQGDTETNVGKSKGRKKAKETDGRWSKRFNWPDELHRDFVSAVFDVGLKHSSPSTILEHMPKHPQITSERIKSHLQKYRVHRAKSKQEFMSSYDATIKKFKSGEMDDVRSLTNGEVAAHLTHTAQRSASDRNDPNGCNKAETKAPAATNLSNPQPSGAQQAGGYVMPSSASQGPTSGHEALLLPKLSESEKMSPIGASMGYLLGLFFSLKKQLLVQRASNAHPGVPALSEQPAVGSSHVPGNNVVPGGDVPNAPVTDVYNSFIGGQSPMVQGSAAHPAPAQAAATAMPPPPVMASPNIDWSSSKPPAINASHDVAHSAPAPATTVSNPNVQTGSTRSNLEVSSAMKREMQNQMAFQNKMRALKQQELNKYKDVPTHSAVQLQENSTPDSNDGHQHHKEVNTPETSEAPQTQHRQGSPDDGRGMQNDEDIQRAGETAAALRPRAPSFSMGGSDDFWNADVMDEQLFEFLMNN